MAAFRLASKGRSIDQPSYVTERESILTLLNMQIPSSNRHQKKFDIEPDNYVSQKLSKKYKSKQVIRKLIGLDSSSRFSFIGTDSNLEKTQCPR